MNHLNDTFFLSFPVPPAEAALDERVQRRSTVRLGIRLIHKICPDSTAKASVLETATVNSCTAQDPTPAGFGPKSPPITVDSPSNSSCSTATNPATTPTSTANTAVANTGTTTTGSVNNSTIPRSLRLRLSPKSLKLTSLHRHSSSVDSSNGGIKSFGEHGIIELTDVNKVIFVLCGWALRMIGWLVLAGVIRGAGTCPVSGDGRY